jgi:hypothetical protein
MNWPRRRPPDPQGMLLDGLPCREDVILIDRNILG